MLTLHMNGEEIQLIAIPRAHTDGDTMVYFPGLDVIMTGDFYRAIQYPNVDRANGGSLQGLIDGLGVVIGHAGPRHENRSRSRPDGGPRGGDGTSRCRHGGPRSRRNSGCPREDRGRGGGRPRSPRTSTRESRSRHHRRAIRATGVCGLESYPLSDASIRLGAASIDEGAPPMLQVARLLLEKLTLSAIGAT
jgi:hypothetical protein